MSLSTTFHRSRWSLVLQKPGPAYVALLVPPLTLHSSCLRSLIHTYTNRVLLPSRTIRPTFLAPALEF